MGTAFSYDSDDFRLKLVEDIKSMKCQSGDDIMTAIQSFRREIAEQIEYIESQICVSENHEIKMAVLIRQDQYLEYLQTKQKHELVEMFSDTENCIVPDVLRWYNAP